MTKTNFLFEAIAFIFKGIAMILKLSLQAVAFIIKCGVNLFFSFKEKKLCSEKEHKKNNLKRIEDRTIDFLDMTKDL